MAAIRLRMPQLAGYARRNTAWNGCLERAERSAAGPPPILSPMKRPPRQRTPQHLPLPDRGRRSRHGRRPSPLRTLRYKSSPRRLSPSPPSRRRGLASSEKQHPLWSRPLRVDEALHGNRGGSRPGIGYSGAAGQKPYPRPRMIQPALAAGKLGGTTMLHHAQPPHQEHLCAKCLKDIPFQGRACPCQRKPRRESRAIHTER